MCSIISHLSLLGFSGFHNKYLPLDLTYNISVLATGSQSIFMAKMLTSLRIRTITYWGMTVCTGNPQSWMTPTRAMTHSCASRFIDSPLFGTVPAGCPGTHQNHPQFLLHFHFHRPTALDKLNGWSVHRGIPGLLHPKKK